MILGKIIGKVTTHAFQFEVTGTVHNLDYVKVYHPAYDYVLCQIIELATTTASKIASCIVIGYASKERMKHIRIPFEPGSEVLFADDDFIRDIIHLPSNAAYIGKLEGRDIQISLDLNKLLTKHVSVLAKSGAGKSYTVGVLLEEILEHGVPCVIIDPHGEHATLRMPATPNADEKERMARFGVQPKGYEIIEFEQQTNPLQLSNRVTRLELEHLLPKLNTTQQGLLYQAIRSDDTDFDHLLATLEAEESMAKWSLINLIEGLRHHNLFSSNPTAPTDLVRTKRAAVINLKGYPPDLQETIVYKIAKDLFDLRKQNVIPPFFLVIEEAHNFCPERSFGEAASSKILRTIASEGRKFGLGLCVISQRPARVDKSVLSQCTTQILLKITNPHDLKAVSSSVEGLTSETEQEIKNLPIGVALITGVVDLPLVVSIRPRRCAHGGDAVDILNHSITYSSTQKPTNNSSHSTHSSSISKNTSETKNNFAKKDSSLNKTSKNDFLSNTTSKQTNDDGELLPVLLPTITPKDMQLMHDGPLDIETILCPVTRFVCEKDGQFILVIERVRNELVLDLEGTTKKLPGALAQNEKNLLKVLLKKKKLLFTDIQSLGVSQAHVDSLIAKGYAVKKNNTLTLSSLYYFGKLHAANLATPLRYEKVFAKKLKERYSKDDARIMLQKYCTIKDAQDCYLVQYRAKKQTANTKQ